MSSVCLLIVRALHCIHIKPENFEFEYGKLLVYFINDFDAEQLQSGVVWTCGRGKGVRGEECGGYKETILS